MSYTISVDRPASYGHKPYARKTQTAVLSGDRGIRIWCTTTLAVPARARIVGPDGLLLEGEPFTETHWWYPNWSSIPSGQYIVSFDSVYPSLDHAIIVDNDGVPLNDGKIPVTPINNWGDEGQESTWIDYPGGPPRPMPMKVRQAEPWGERLTERDLWVERFTVTALTHAFAREFNRTQEGHVIVMPNQVYYEHDKDNVSLGTCVAGYRGKSKSGHPMKFLVLKDGASLCIEGQGRIVHYRLDGSSECVFGWNLKEGELPLCSTMKDYSYEAESRAQHDFIGTYDHLLNAPFGFDADPLDFPTKTDEGWTGTLLIADTFNSRVAKLDLATRHLETVLGQVGVRAFADGKTGLLNRPRDVLYSDDGQNIYIADEYNHALRVSDRDWNLSTVVKSNHVHEGHVDVPSKVSLAREIFKPGAFGESNFLHPNAIQWFSDGTIGMACHHMMGMVRVDLQKKTIELLTWLHIGKMDRAWISLAIDRHGALGPVDDFFTQSWSAGSDHRYDKDGNHVGRITSIGSASDDVAMSGPAEYCQSSTYGQALGIDPKGALWVGATAGSRINRYTKRKADDPTIEDLDRFIAGKRLFNRDLSLRYGLDGQNLYGGPNFYDFARMTAQQLAQEIRQHVPMTDEEISDVHYWAKTAMEIDGGVSEVTPEPEPTPEPIPEPTITKQEALAAIDVLSRFVNQ